MYCARNKCLLGGDWKENPNLTYVVLWTRGVPHASTKGRDLKEIILQGPSLTDSMNRTAPAQIYWPTLILTEQLSPQLDQ